MSLYDEVIKVAKDYMGLAAEEFIGRQYKVNIGGGDPKDIKNEDIRGIAEAIGITAGAYIVYEKVQLFKAEILNLEK